MNFLTQVNPPSEFVIVTDEPYTLPLNKGIFTLDYIIYDVISSVDYHKNLNYYQNKHKSANHQEDHNH